MADHMTAEQLRAALLAAADQLRPYTTGTDKRAMDAYAVLATIQAVAARLSGMAADTCDRCEYVVRQHLKHAAGGIFVDVWKAPAERLALDVYATYIGDFPHQYFEVLRITHREDCIVHNGIPDYAPAAPEPPHV